MFTRYANLTTEQKDHIVATYKESLKFYPPDQAIACTANDALGLTDRQWNSKIGADAFAATLATLVMAGTVEVQVAD